MNPISIAVSVAVVAIVVVRSNELLSPTFRRDLIDFSLLPRALAFLIGTHLVLTWLVGPAWAAAGFVIVLVAQLAPWTWGRSRTIVGPPPTPGSDTVDLSPAEREAFNDLARRA